MNVIDAINQRRAVKHYDSKFIVPEGDEKQILETAILAPSSFNIQHWRVVNVKDKAIRAQLCEAAWDQAQVKDASLLFVLCGDVKAWQKNPERYWRNSPKETQEFIIPLLNSFYEGNEELQNDEVLRSVGILAQTMMLTAKDLGYDSCPMIGFDQAKVAQIINLPNNYKIGMFLVIGKATKPAFPKPGQIPLAEVFFTDTF